AMQGKGLVERRQASSDRRRSIIAPTATGRRRMVRTRARRREDTADLLADWTDGELRTLAETFTRYNRTVVLRYLSPGDDRAPVSSPVAAQILLPERGSSGPHPDET
ncbi:MAG: hypothetical protein ACRDP6_06095, partial [Actinoallomurus sp.]